MSITRILPPISGSPSSLIATTQCLLTRHSRQWLRSEYSTPRLIYEPCFNRRRLQTATVHRPQTLEPHQPPPTNAVPGESYRATTVTTETNKKSVVRGTQETNKPQSLPDADVETLSSTPSIGKEKPTRASKLRPRKAAMLLTPAAVSQLRELLSQPDPKLIRVGVKNRGCSGLAYHLEYVDKPAAFDETVEQDGVRILIDSKALFSIIGSEMDWVVDKLAQRFVFRNPNIKEQCGCGESFMV